MHEAEKTTSPEQHLMAFMSAMCRWEMDLSDRDKSSEGTYLNAKENKDATRAALIRIYEQFLTPKERKTGRVAALDFGTPLAFDPTREKITNTAIDGSKAVIDTTYSTYAELKRRYTLKKTRYGWRIDKMEKFSAYKNQWLNSVL